MALILLADNEASTVDHIRSVLASQGWLVKTVDSRDRALRAASEFAPQLVLISESLAGASDLVRTFSLRSGGPGVVLMTSGNGAQTQLESEAAHIDAVLPKPLETEELITTIRAGLAASKQRTSAVPAPESRRLLTSEDIFGDFLDGILDRQQVTDRESAGPSEPGLPKVPPEIEVQEPATAADQTAAPVPDQRSGLADLEEVVREEVSAWAEGVESTAQGPPDAASSATPQPSTPSEPAAPLESRPPAPSTPLQKQPQLAASASPPEARPAPLAAAPPPARAEPPSGLLLPAQSAVPTTSPPRTASQHQSESPPPPQLEPPVAPALPAETERARTAGAPVVESPVDTAPAHEPAGAESSSDDLDSRLDDTLAGVLAESLLESSSGQDRPSSEDQEIDRLLSRALGDLGLGLPAVGASAPLSVAADAVTPARDEPTLAPSFEIVDSESLADGDAEPASEFALPMPADPEPLPAAAGEAMPELEEGLEQEAATPGEPPPWTEPPPAGDGARADLEFGEYALEERIGVGGMAEVWKARRKGVQGFEKRVAVKRILPHAAENAEFVEMFIDEAKLAAQLNHNNIIHIYDLGKIGDDYFIAMEHVQGKNLRQLLDQARTKGRPLPARVALLITSRLAEALDYAHRSKDFDNAELGVVHRDVSPQNVLLSYSGDVKLCDFGIAKAVSKISTTKIGALKGKLHYMSPEQAWGRSIDPRSDIFSVGVLLFEMLTGERLFQGDSEMAILEAVRDCDVAGRIVESEDIPSGAKGLLLKALAKEPADRISSAAELQQTLEELLSEESTAPSSKDLALTVAELFDRSPASVVEVGVEAEPLSDVSPAESKEPDEGSEDAALGPTETGGVDGGEQLPSIDEEQLSSIDQDELAVQDESEEEKQTWLRRLLTRLVPVVLIAGVGGGILAGLMVWDRQSQRVEPTAPAAESPSSGPQEAREAGPATNEPAPPPAEQEVRQTEAPSGARTSGPSTRPSGDPAEDLEGTAEQSTVTAGASPEPPSGGTPPATGEGQDPELERRVQQELRRVEELMSASAAAGSRTRGVAEGPDPEEDPEAGEAANPTPSRSGPPPVARAGDHRFPAAPMEQDVVQIAAIGRRSEVGRRTVRMPETVFPG